MKRLRKLVCVILTILLTINMVLPVGAAETATPSITSIRPTVLPAFANSFYFYVNGSDFGTDPSSLTVEIFDAAQPGVNLINVTRISAYGNSIRVSCRTNDGNGLKEQAYTLKVTKAGQSAEYTVNAINTPVIPHMRPSQLPINASTVEFRFEGSNFDLLTNGQYTVELYVVDESSNEVVVGTANSANMINNGSNIDVKVNFSHPELLTKDKVVHFRIKGPTQVYYGVPLEFIVVDTIIITKFNSVKFNQSAEDGSNPNYEFEFYGYNLSGKTVAAELKDSTGQLIENLTATGATRTDGVEYVTFTLSKAQRTLSGSYTIEVPPTSGTYSLNVSDTIPQPVIKELKAGSLPSGYSKFGIRMIGANLSDNASVINFYLYDAANNNILGSRKINYIFPYGQTDKGIDAELTLISSYNNNQGLKNGESYGLVVEINGIKSQPFPVIASNVPMIYMPMSWNITPNASKYYVEFKGYNLQGFADNVTSARLVDYTSGTPNIVATTSNVQLIEDYIDTEHLKFYFESVDLSQMALDEVAMFEIDAAAPYSFVTGDIGIRLSNDSYITSYGYSNRSSEYYYNAYGFNLAGSYTLTFTNISDSTMTYSTPLEMVTEDQVYYKANVSIPKNMPLSSGMYNVVVTDASGNQIASRTDNLSFGELGITNIKPSILPANYIDYILLELQCFGLGTNRDLVELRLYDPANLEQNIVGPVFSKSIGTIANTNTATFNIGLISSYNDNQGLIAGRTYNGELYYNGQLFDTFNITAEENPLIRNVYPAYLPEAVPGFNAEFAGWNLDKINLSTAKAELLLRQSDGSFIKVGEGQQLNLYNSRSLNGYITVDPAYTSQLVDDSFMELKLVNTGTSDVVYYMRNQNGIQVKTFEYITDFNFYLFNSTLMDTSLSNVSIQFQGYNLFGTYTIEAWDPQGNKIGADLATTKSSSTDKIDSVTAELDKNNVSQPGEYMFRLKSDRDGGTVLSTYIVDIQQPQSMQITDIRPEVIPASDENFYFYINGNGFGENAGELEIVLYDATDSTPDLQENLIRVADIIAWGDTLRVEFDTLNQDGLDSKAYRLKVVKGSQIAEYDVNAIDTPVIAYMSPDKLPVNASSTDVYMEGANFDLITNGSYTLQLYTKDESNAETEVGSKIIPTDLDDDTWNHYFTVPIVKPELLLNGTTVYYRIAGPTTVYYGGPQEMMVVDTPIVSWMNYQRLTQSMNNNSLQHLEFEFFGFNMEGRTLTADIRDNSGQVVKTLTTTGLRDNEGREYALFLLPKNEPMPEGDYSIRMNPDTVNHTFTFQNSSWTISSFDEARAEGSIADGAATSYEFAFSGVNLDGRRLTAELRDAQGVVLEVLNAIGIRATDGSEGVTFKLPKSYRILPVGSYSISVIGSQSEYSFGVSADTNNYYDIYLNVVHDVQPNTYEGLSIRINGKGADFRALDGNGSLIIEGVVNGLYDIQIIQPKHLTTNITAVVNNADSTGNSVVLKGGDSNGDSLIDIDDLIILAMSYDSANIDVRADIDNNGFVNLKDLSALAVNFGKESKKEIGIQAWGESLDPNAITSTNEILVANAVYEGLVRVHGGQIQPGMAQDWTVSPDGLIYTFHLRDAFWSDGVPVTAYDFQYSILRLLDPALEFAYAYQGHYIRNGMQYNNGAITDASQVGVRVINEKTLEIELNAPCKYFLSLLGSVSFMPVRKDIVSILGPGFGYNIDNMVFNGPFIPLGWNALTRNVDYWNKQSVNLESVELHDVNNDDAVNMYKADVLDIANLSANYIEQYQQNGEIKYASDGSVWYLQLNVNGKANDATQGTGKYLNNADFRKAMALAIDRRQFVDVQTNGVSSPAERYVHPRLMGNEDYYSVEKPLSYYAPNAQVELAQQHLQAALSALGTTEIPTIELLIDNRPAPYNQAMMLKDMLMESLGIDLVITQADFQTRMELMNQSQYDIVLAGWGPDYDDPMTYLDMWVTEGGPNNTNWSSSEYDALINYAKTTTDMNLRLDKMFEAEQYLLENGPIIPIYFRNNAYVQKANLEGVVRNFIGPQIDFIYADLTE